MLESQCARRHHCILLVRTDEAQIQTHVRLVLDNGTANRMLICPG